MERSLDIAREQYSRLVEALPSNYVWPHSLKADGSLRTTPISWWTVGFFPGSLWYIFEYTGDNGMRESAKEWTESLYDNQFVAKNHDIGFQMNCSYGNALRITSNEDYVPVLINSADALCERFSPAVGCIKSWNTRKNRTKTEIWEFPVIIDNMMNLELLFAASALTGDDKYRDIAVEHANKTMANHVRPDYSTYQAVNYDPLTGEVLTRRTIQGYADESTWARGQAWALYGFTMSYRFTRDPAYLETARGMADFILGNPNLPDDMIPYWDYNAGQAGYEIDVAYSEDDLEAMYRDASAGAITASALLELSSYCEPEGRRKYFEAAEKMLASLSSSSYLAKPGTNGGFLLMHCVGHLPAGTEVDVPLNYADYYYLEGLLRYDKLKK